MKSKIASILLILVFIIPLVLFPPSYADAKISVELDGNAVEFDTAPQISNGYTLVPLRKLFEELGALVKWNSETQTVSARKSSKTVTLTIGSDEMTVDKGKTDSEGNAITETVMLDAPAQIVSGRTLVPLRAISEAFGLDVSWDEDTMTAVLTSEAADDLWKENKGTIDLDSLSVTGNGVCASSGNISITSGGDFTVTGTLTNGSITVNTDQRVKLRLSGASVTSEEGPCIFIENADKAFITLTDGTENSLYAKNSDKGAVYSKDKLEIKGDGNLKITSPAGHGIKVSDNLTLENGTLNIDAASDGIHVNDTFKMTGGSLFITSVNDGIDSESIASITGGKISIKTTATPITGSGTQSNSGTFMHGEAASVEFESSTKGIKADWMLKITGGEIDVHSSSHAIHCADEAEITGGKITLYSEYGKGISAHGNLTIDNAETEITVTKSTEGIESKNILTINDGIIKITASDDAVNATGGNSGDNFGGGPGGGNFGGGRPNMRPNGEQNANSSRPDKGFSGADASAVSFDEADKAAPEPPSDFDRQMNVPDFSAGHDRQKTTPDFSDDRNSPSNVPTQPMGGGRQSLMKDCLVINGGVLELYAGDDCLDSNGNLIINGGTIKACKTGGTFTGANAVIDPDGKTVIGSDAVLILAAGGGSEGKLSQCSVTVYCEAEHNAGEVISISDSANGTLLTFAPAGGFKSVLIASPALTIGQEYTVSVGGESHSVLLNSAETTIGTLRSDGNRKFGR